MNIRQVKTFVKLGKKFLTDYATPILVGIGIGGMCIGTVAAVKATPAAMEHIKQAESTVEEMTPLRTAEACWKDYAPAVIIMTASAASIIAGTANGMRREAALAAAYKLATDSLQTYKDTVHDIVDDETEQKISTSAASKVVAKHVGTPVAEGMFWCTDSWTGQRFVTSPSRIKDGENTLNELVLQEGWVLVNDLLSILGERETDAGYMFGFDVGKGLMKIKIDSVVVVEDNRTELVISYEPQLSRAY